MSRPATPAATLRARSGNRALATFAMFVSFVIAAVVLARPASAHAVLVSSSPADGERVAAQPAAVELRFDETIGLVPGATQVISTTGARADTGKVRVVDGGTTIVLPLKPNLPSGTYSATWRVVSADTHVVSGSVTFGLGVEPGAGVSAPPDRTHALAVTDDVAQVLVYAGVVLLVGIGSAATALWPWVTVNSARRRVFRTADAGWWALFLGSALQFLLEGPRANNESWAGFARLDGIKQTVGSTWGHEMIGRTVFLLVLVPLAHAMLREPRSRALVATGIGANAIILLSVGLSGHAGVGADAPLAVGAAVLHLAAMAFWLGGLVLLITVVLPALRRDEVDIAAARLPQWSATAYTCVVALVVTGEYLASRQTRPLQALWSTRYGVVLLIKVALVGTMLTIAYATQRSVVRLSATAAQLSPDAADHPTAMRTTTQTTTLLTTRAPSTAEAREITRRVSRKVGIEAGIAVGVLVATAILVSEAPARTTYGPATTMSAPLGPDRVTVHVNTTRRGPQVLDIHIVDSAGELVSAQSVAASLSSASVAALDVHFTNVDSDGQRWQSENAVLPLPGRWTLSLDIALSPTSGYATSASYTVW